VSDTYLSQDDLEKAVLGHLFAHANHSDLMLSYGDVAVATGLPAARVQMALRKLEGERAVRATHNTIKGSHYMIAEEAYRQVEAVNFPKPVNFDDASSVGLIPASDRIVSLTHNQQIELEDHTTAVIQAVEKENQIDGDPSLRQKILGQLKAGRELLRATIFDGQILILTLVETLKWLVSRYDQGIIGGLAAGLLVELAKVAGLFS
jgi:hypothetical protein